MIRTRIAAALTVGAIAIGTLAAASPAQAAGYPFGGYNQRFLDIGPVVYTIEIKAASEAQEKVVIGGKSTSVNSEWVISQDSVSDRSGGYDEDGNEVTYPELPEIHVGYWVARYAASQLGAAEDRFADGTVQQAVDFYRSVTTVPAGEAQAYFAAPDAKAARISAVKADVQRNADRAWKYVSALVNKHRGANYVHAHKAAIIKALGKKFTKSKLYSGSVKLKFTSDVVVQMGPSKADRERFIHYMVTVRDSTDKVAYAIDMNTHEGGAYGVHKVKY